MKQKYKELVEVSALAGIILLEAHAESYRVEDTVRRMLKTSGLSRVEVVSTTTSLYITLDDISPEVEPYTVIRRVDKRGNHLNKIYRVNNISRDLTSGKIDVSEAHRRLDVVNESEYTVMSKDFGIICIVVGFAILLGGSIWDILIAFLAGSIVALSRIAENFLSMNSFITATFTTFLTAFIISALSHLLPVKISSDLIIISALMPLFPGMAFTNGLRDTLKGDYVSGVARIADALVIALSIALGVALGLSLVGGIF